MNTINSQTDSAKGFRVTIVADSVHNGVRLTTFACRFPRVILAEVNTHRAISKNAASSRAIPSSYLIEQVKEDPYIPGDLPDGELCGNEPGMVATKRLSDEARWYGQPAFRQLAYMSAVNVQGLSHCGWHKQDVNRLLEPFQWVRWVGTATNWDNFFALRTDHRAYPPFRFLARCMWVAFQRSVPAETKLHLPFITDEDRRSFRDMVEPPSWVGEYVDHPDDRREWYNLMAWSAARCARVSVKNFRTDDTDRRKDMDTFLKLTTETPKHSSPLEHQAVALDWWSKSHPRSNFSEPWFQFRKMLPDETAWEFSPSEDEVRSWNIPDGVFGGTPGVDW